MKKLKMLFLCTANSCRSQMAQGLTRHLRGDVWEIFSAGIEPGKLDPVAVEVLAEIGIDISDQYSKHVNDFKEKNFDYVMTVCDRAKEKCPKYTGSEPNLHFGFDDPSSSTFNASHDEKLKVYRRVRDLMYDVIVDTLDSLIETSNHKKDAL